MSRFLDEPAYSADQIRFIGLSVQELTVNGVQPAKTFACAFIGGARALTWAPRTSVSRDYGASVTVAA
jgi:hypothetical protein